MVLTTTKNLSAPATPNFSIPLRVLFEARAPKTSEKLVGEEKTALHSGKLGDIIYALPACRSLGIRHLVLNTYLPAEEPLRRFPFRAARELVSLLLVQPYIDRVTITEGRVPLEDAGMRFGGIDYNFDAYRRVARHRVGKKILNIEPQFTQFDREDPPAHLGEIFGATLGISPELEDPWLFAPRAPLTKDAVVCSITTNWRSYPDWYWKELLQGLPNVIFVGHEKEWQQAKIPGAKFLKADDHLQLASLIAGSALFLGTVSFPYAIAEGLKVPRAVEVCHRNLNAFPLGKDGFVLPPDIQKARRLVEKMLGDAVPRSYANRRLALSTQISRRKLNAQMKWVRANQSYFTHLKNLLRRVIRSGFRPRQLNH